MLREYPFNLKGGEGAMIFFGEKNSVCKFALKTFLSLKWAEKNILLAFCALKIIVFVEKK